ncbi:hypothetical protein [Streptococcus canis]|uniref:Phage protein n=1 Tax=Streptococcus canis FSL Z3-227 TaxID=482234 RepID=A0AAV3FU90_STRCB|nr:hypothetical protein [Streptococcus canis]EIQ82693.1 hypothetical protein SCAZ3_10040 [Streptococcus canis FSL Z3-227]MDV6000867.1 hypothetical protein [Streptococcus canis]
MKNEIKNPNEVTLADLRTLGRQGGATAHLDTGEEIELAPQFALVERQGYIAGKRQPVQMILDYATVYRHIRTIKRDSILIARRSKYNKRTALLLTGKGYKRK